MTIVKNENLGHRAIITVSWPLTVFLGVVSYCALRVACRFVEENFDQISASLAFTTPLSLVPLVAVVLSIVALVPFFPSMLDQLAQFLARSLLPERSAGMIIEYVLQVCHQAVNVTAVGSIALVATTLVLLLTIERVFNHLWSVMETRPWWHRLRLFAGLIALWPLVIGGVVLATSYAVTTSLGLLDEPPWLRRLLFKALGLMVASLFLGGSTTPCPTPGWRRGTPRARASWRRSASS